MYTVLYITHSIELVGVQAVKRTNIKRRAISDTVLLNLEVNQIINIKEVIQFTDVSCSTIYEIMDEFALYYDPTFPKKVKITQNRIGWSVYEIHQCIENRFESRE